MTEMLGANPAELRSLAADMEMSATSFDSARTQLASTFSSIRWRGPDAARSIDGFHNQQAPQLISAVSLLRDCAKKLRNNADEQDKASSVDSLSSSNGGSGAGGDSTSGHGPGVRPGPAPLPVAPPLPGGKPEGSVSIKHGTDSDEVTVTNSNSVDGKQPLAKIPGLGGLDPEKFKVGGGIKNVASVGVEIGHTDTTTSFKVTSTVETEANASIDLKRFGLNGSLSDGQKFEYTVTVPKGTDPLSIDPNDSATWPPGTTVQIDSSDTSAQGMGIKYGALGLDSKVSSSDGTSQIIAKNPDGKVSVMTGPTNSITNSATLSLGLDEIKASIGASKSLTDAKLHSATFDLNTPQGQAAINEYMSTGKIPSNDGPGVTNVATIGKVTFTSGSEAGIKLGPLELGGKAEDYTSSIVSTTYGDGHSDQLVNVHRPGSPDMVMTTKFDHAGNPVPGSGNYSYQMNNISDFDAQILNTKSYSGINGGGFKSGDNITVNLTAQQLATFQDTAKAAHQDIIQGSGDSTVLGTSSDLKPSQFAGQIQIAGQHGYSLLNSIAEVNQQANGLEQGNPREFPGSVTKR